MDLTRLIDLATPEPILVIGSLPPAGRDLDLLVRPAAAAALAEALAGAGYHRVGRTWARFAECGAEVVELIAAQDFGLDTEQLDLLFGEAEPIAGLTHLARPAAHHRLLILANKLAAERELSAKRRDAATREDEDAWRLARETAPRWGAQAVLSDLERALRGNPPRSRSVLARIRHRRAGALIAFSGLDGAGKTTQVEGLERALSALGYPVVTVWTSMAGHPSLARVAAPVRMLLLGRARMWRGDVERPAAGEDADRLTLLRERTPLVHFAWVSFVAAMNAWWQARAVRPNLLRGRIVICDRYTLDSLVHLRYRYGEHRRYRAHLALIRLLSPRPLRAYLLQVSPAAAYARNQEFTPAQVEQRARLYAQEHEALGVICLDGERPREELCAQIALEVWSALSR